MEREFDWAIGQKKEELRQLDESLLRVRQLLQVGELRQRQLLQVGELRQRQLLQVGNGVSASCSR